MSAVHAIRYDAWYEFARPLVFSAACVVPLQVGTGGQATAAFHSIFGHRGYALTRHEYEQHNVTPVVEVASVPDDLKLIREFLKPSVAELANALSVSRQSIYDWQAGKHISQENSGRVRELAIACAELSSAGIMPSSQLLRRKILAGQNLLVLVANDNPGRETAQMLVSVLQSEQRQREALSSRLDKAVDMTDFGRPHLHEES